MNSEYNQLLSQPHTYGNENSPNTSQLDYDDEPSYTIRHHKRQASRSKAQTEEYNSSIPLKSGLGDHEINEQYELLSQYMPEPAKTNAKKQPTMQIFGEIQQQLNLIFKPMKSNKVGVQSSQRISTN